MSVRKGYGASDLLLMLLSGGAPPPAPVNLAITGASSGVVNTQTPEATADAVAGATGYDFEIALTSVGLTGTPTATNQPTPAYTSAALLNFTSYTVAIRARNAAGQGPWSDGVVVQTAVYLLRDDMTTMESAPMASPRTAEPGPGTLTLVQTDGQLSIADVKMSYPAQTTPTFGDQGFYSAGLARAAGRALVSKDVIANTGAAHRNAWLSAAAVPTGIYAGVVYAGLYSGTAIVDAGAANFQPTIAAINNGETIQFALVLRGTGCHFFIKGGGNYTNWSLAWVSVGGAQATLYPGMGNFNGSGALDQFRVADLPAPFTTDNGIATLNVASPIEQDYTAMADQLIDLTLTAPGSITEEAGIIYRKLDADNYWRAFFDTSGALRLDSVSAGTPTNRINVAGVISAGATVTIRVICSGTKHNVYSLAGNTWTKMGAEVNVSHQDTQVTVQPDIGAGWTAANLRSYPRTSAQYAILDLL